MDVDPNWSLEEAWAATQEALRADPSRSGSDPTLPIYRWDAIKQLEDWGTKFKQDADMYWVLLAIRMCANHDLRLPDWTAAAYIGAFDKVHNAREKSWDAAFDSPYPKETHLNAVRKRRLGRLQVWSLVQEIRKKDPDRPIDQWLFEEVGAELGIGKTLASEYYYEAVKSLPRNSEK